MKAISLWQPWASAIGPHPEQKHLETRSWQTPYRGWLAIHAAKRWTKEQQWVLQHGEAGSSLFPIRSRLAERRGSSTCPTMW